MENYIISELAKTPSDIQTLIIKFMADPYEIAENEALEYFYELAEIYEDLDYEMEWSLYYDIFNDIYYIEMDHYSYQEYHCLTCKDTLCRFGRCFSTYRAMRISEKYFNI